VDEEDTVEEEQGEQGDGEEEEERQRQNIRNMTAVVVSPPYLYTSLQETISPLKAAVWIRKASL
jgi:hypothetical protein